MGPKNTFRLGLGALATAGVLRAWQLRFLQDDAFISFRYAWNLAHHGELAWNLGERVEGFSNPLWVLLLAAGLKLGIEPQDSSWLLGISAYVACLLLAGVVAKGLLETLRPLQHRDLLPLATLFLLPLNQSSAAYATGGLSTSLFAAGILLCVWLTLLRPLHWSGSLALGGLLLVRPEAMLISPFLAAVVCWQHRSLGARRLALWCLPLAAIAALLLAFKLHYFGAILPNTAHAKSVFDPYPARGLRYLRSFVLNTPTALLLLLPGALGALHALRGSAPALRRALLPPSALLLLLLGYVAWVGGDFMEYKPLMHLYPLAMALGAGSLAVALRDQGAQVGALCLLLLLPSGVDRPLQLPDKVFNTHTLWAQLRRGGGRWVEIGHRLRETLPPDTRIAVTAAGAIPYHSRLPAVDMLGLTNREVAHQALESRGDVGHEKWADDALLMRAGVDLKVAHPTVLTASSVPLTPDTLLLRLEDGAQVRMQWVHRRPELEAWVRAHPEWFSPGSR